MARKTLALVLFVAGVVWSIGFPKSASLEWDMVFSVCLALGLLGSALLVLAWPRMRPTTGVLALLLLWSLLGNAFLFAWSDAEADALQALTRNRSQAGPGAELSGGEARPDGR